MEIVSASQFRFRVRKNRGSWLANAVATRNKHSEHVNRYRSWGERARTIDRRINCVQLRIWKARECEATIGVEANSDEKRVS